MADQVERALSDPGRPGDKVEPTRRSLEWSLEALKARHPDVQLALSLRREGLAVSMIRVPPGLQGHGRADAALTDLLRWADRHRQIVAVTPERVGTGASSGALRRWYRRHGFVLNTGRNKDFSFTQAMIREPRDAERPMARSAAAPAQEQPNRGAEIARATDRAPGRSDPAGFEL